jgi:hypothetical protein
LREAHGVFEQHVAHAVDALEQRERQTIDVGDGKKASGSACQMKACARSKSGFRGGSGARRSSARAIRSTSPPIGSRTFMVP